jgi:hypothetical protein
MKRQFNLLYSLLFLIGLSLSVASCSSDSPSGNDGNGDKPTVTSFTATPGSITIGNPTTLAWSVSNATNISIDNGLGAQSGSSVVVYPTANTTYTLTATNSAGSTTSTVTVSVQGTISRIDIVPSDPQSLQPGGTVQLTAKAYGTANNDLNLPQTAFTWSSTNNALAQVSASGLVSVPAAITAGGIAQVTAAAGDVKSAPVAINVQLQKATTLVIFHPKGEGESFAAYTSAFGTTSFDFVTDRAGNADPTTITLESIKGYERVFYFSHDDYPMHATTKSVLKLYASMPNKRLVIMGNSNQVSDDAGFMSFLGLQSEEYMSSSAINSTFTGGAGTVMEGFNFEHIADFAWLSQMTPKVDGSAAMPAFMATVAETSAPAITAIQTNVGTSSKVFYSGFVLENVQVDLRDDFIARLMTM